MKTFTKRVSAVILALTLAAGMFVTALAAEHAAQEMPEVRIIAPTDEAIEIALADFDYMVAIILENLPAQGMGNRRFGAELGEFFGLIREFVAYGEPNHAWTSLLWGENWQDAQTDTVMMAADYLASILIEINAMLGGFAHMMPLSPDEFERILTNMLVLQYIEENNIDIGRDLSLETALVNAKLDVFLTPASLWLYNIDPQNIDAGNLDLITAVTPVIENNITTQIIQPDSIAYIHISSFFSNPEVDGEILAAFFAEVQDFDNLIIDVRGNPGGFPHFVTYHIIGMLIDEPLNFTFSEFFADGELTMQMLTQSNFTHLVLPNSTADGAFPARAYVEANNLTGFNMDDLAYIQYVVPWSMSIQPSENAVPFAGDIWVLADGGSGSASEVLSLISVSTGFATVVGEPTAGVTGVTTLHISLPNTGIIFRLDVASITDPTGRSLEEFGITPDIPNADGLDAFGTVLSIIAPDLLAAHMEAMAAANPFNEVPVVYVDGIAFVPIRLAAYAFDWQIEWDGPNNSAILKDLQGNVWVVAVGEFGVFNDNGRLFMPLEIAVQLFN